MDRVECVIVGAGVIGLAVARRLAQAGREVVVLEAAEGIGTVTSSRNSEVIHAGIYYLAGSWMARMCVTGKHALYRDGGSALGNLSSLKKFGLNADLKHGRAIVVAPPSLHDSGAISKDEFESLKARVLARV